MTRGRGLALAVVLGAVLRAPFVAVALRLPIDADTAIIGLMARHPARFPTMWGQPYGSPVEGWLALPFLLAVHPDAAAMRAFYAVLGLLLVPLAFVLAEAVDPRAALPAALLAACPPSYVLLLAALPPPLYPSTLLLGGLVLILAIQIANGWRDGRREFGRAALWGILGGLALWTHLTALAAVAASAALLLWSGLRQRRTLLVAALTLLAASAPLWDLELRYQGMGRVVRLHSGAESFGEHLALVARGLPFALGGVLGAHAPVLADSRAQVWAPRGVVLLLALAYAASLLLLLKPAWREARVRLVLLAALFSVLLFLVPIRSQPHTLRFLAALYLPATVGVALAWSAAARGRLRFAAVALVCGLNLAGAVRLLEELRRLHPSHPPYGVGALDQVQAFLETHGLRRAFASYEPAYRITFATDERLLVSQPWNERFPGHPLPYLDEVSAAPDAAWILVNLPGATLPHPHGFEALLSKAGERWHSERFGALSVYYGFEPPLPRGLIARAEAPGPPGSARRRPAPSRHSAQR